MNEVVIAEAVQFTKGQVVSIVIAYAIIMVVCAICIVKMWRESDE